MSAEGKITLIALRNILLNGRHVAALAEIEVDEAAAKTLIAQRVAVPPKPAGVARARSIDTATHAPLVAEVATSAPASAAGGAPAKAAPRKPPKRKAAQ